MKLRDKVVIAVYDLSTRLLDGIRRRLSNAFDCYFSTTPGR